MGVRKTIEVEFLKNSEKKGERRLKHRPRVKAQ